MSQNSYRPSIRAGSAKHSMLIKLIKLANQHESELELTEQEEIALFKFSVEIGSRHLVKQRLQELSEEPPKQPQTIYEVDLDDLEHRLWESEGEYGRGKLPDEDEQRLREEITRRKVRDQEQKPQRLTPSSVETDSSELS